MIKRSIAIVVALVLCFTMSLAFSTAEVQAASTTHLKKSSITLTIGKSYSQKLLTASGKTISASKVTWKSTNKSIATVSTKGVIKAKKEGNVTIKAVYKGKTYKCKCTVKNDVWDQLPKISAAVKSGTSYYNKSIQYLKRWETASSIKAAETAADMFDVAIEECGSYSELSTLKGYLKSVRNSLRGIVETAKLQSNTAAYNTLFSGLSNTLSMLQRVTDEMKNIAADSLA